VTTFEDEPGCEKIKKIADSAQRDANLEEVADLDEARPVLGDVASW
jgi:hypothetical protein